MDGEEKTYGGCEGPDAMYVKLISSDGHEFIVKREHALTSGTIKAMLSGPEAGRPGSKAHRGLLGKSWRWDMNDHPSKEQAEDQVANSVSKT
uniref:Elongin C n=1 Tax=Vombatus ursinus TaxID=29139 RepID=A0A4X2LIT0_VOMUR